jgi:hypothetical protein
MTTEAKLLAELDAAKKVMDGLRYSAYGTYNLNWAKLEEFEKAKGKVAEVKHRLSSITGKRYK